MFIQLLAVPLHNQTTAILTQAIYFLRCFLASPITIASTKLLYQSEMKPRRGTSFSPELALEGEVIPFITTPCPEVKSLQGQFLVLAAAAATSQHTRHLGIAGLRAFLSL